VEKTKRFRISTITKEEVQERINKKHNHTIVFSNYTNIVTKCDFECLICGHKWISTPRLVYSGNSSCQQCGSKRAASKNTLSYEYVKQYIENRGCKLISKEYIKNSKNLDIKFECGKIHKMCFNNFRSGEKDPCTSHQRRYSTISEKSMKKMLEFMDSIGFQFISFEGKEFKFGSIITYSCPKGHTETRIYPSLKRNKNCTICTKEENKVKYLKENSNKWRGGLTELKKYLSKFLVQWKKDSMENSSYKCVITGKRFENIHHVQSFNLLLKESLEELNFELKNTIGEYDSDQITLLVNKLIEVHFRYPLGVALTKKWHNKFHKLYGMGDNTPDQWDDFIQKIKSGKIKTNEKLII